MAIAQLAYRKRRMPINEFIARFRTGQTDFSGVSMHFANLNSLNLQGAVFREADLSFSNLENADLTNADFSGAILSRCTFSRAILRNTNFECADLTFADMRNLRLMSASFKKANLLWAHLCGTDLMKANLQGANLDWACLLDSRVPGDVQIPSKALFVHRGENFSQPRYQSGYVREGVREYGMKNYAARRDERYF